MAQKGAKEKAQAAAESFIELSQLGAIRMEGTQVRLLGLLGEELLRMLCESKEHAKVWQHGLEEVAQLHGGLKGGLGSARKGIGRAAGDAELGSLKDQCQRQEARVSQLEASNRRKEEQLFKLHTRLEEALFVLQAGQKTYADQQKVLEAQQAKIEQLRSRHAAGDASSRQPAAAAAESEADADG